MFKFEKKKQVETECQDKTEIDNNNGQNKPKDFGNEKIQPLVGKCIFQIDPKKTRSIQIFALYKRPSPDLSSSATKSDSEHSSPSENDLRMYFSHLIPLNFEEKEEADDRISGTN